VHRDGNEASGDSIMGLVDAGRVQVGTTIEVVDEGPQAAELADALERLVAGRFGEPF
jgi:phosphocarrier protein HPr